MFKARGNRRLTFCYYELMIRKWDITDQQAKKKCIDEIITRIEEQDGEAFGMLAAQDIIDIVAAHLGPSVHKTAIEDVQKMLRAKAADIEIDLDILKTSQ